MRPTERHEIRAWLGDDWTDEQTEQITDEYLRLERDLKLGNLEERQALLTAIAQRVDGTLDLTELAEADLRAQLRATETRRALRAAARASVAAGVSEYDAAEASGVTRMTVRAWMGKR